MEGEVLWEGIAECIHEPRGDNRIDGFHKGVIYRFQKICSISNGPYYNVFLGCSNVKLYAQFDASLFKKCFQKTLIVAGSSKQDRTNGKVFVITGQYRRPEFGEFYYGELDRCACLSEDSGLDFPEDVKRLILKEAY
jgi:hypothetical protein